MTIELEDDHTGPALPSLKIPEVGDTITGVIVDTNTIDVRNFDTGEIETFDDGNPKKQKVVTVIVQSAEGGAKARLDGDDLAPPVGELATIFTGYAGFYAYREGVQALGRAVRVGDLLTWSTDEEKPPKKKGFNPFKVRSYTFTDNPDAGSIAEAERMHLDRKERIDADSDGHSEDPF